MRSVRTAAQQQRRRRTMQVLLAFIFVVGFAASPANAFTAPAKSSTSFGTSSARRTTSCRRFSTAGGDDNDASSSASASVRPQVFATGYSNNPDLHAALQQAVNSALAALPPLDGAEATRGRSDAKIDLAFVTASSLYNASPATVVPAVLSIASVYGQGIDQLVGCTSGGTISSVVRGDEGGASAAAAATASQSTGQGQGAAAAAPDAAAAAAAAAVRECLPVETEGVPGVSVTLALLPDVDVSTFHVLSEDVPDDVGRVSTREWNNAIGLRHMEASKGEDDDDEPVFLLLPSPAFQSDLDDLMHGISVHHPHSSVIGGVASTVSSLSRAQLFRYDSADPNAQLTLGDGCIGAVLNGDIQVSTMLAQGAKPVGGIYRIVSGQDSTIGAIMLDEEATKEDAEAAEDLKDGADEDEGDEDDLLDAKTRAKAAYAKAAIPKPVLAEANYLMKTLSDDEQTFMRKTILVGLERGGSAVGRSPNELLRLAKGEGHRFSVHQVASAGMKDGSVTLPLGSVNVEKGARFRFFVREGDFARKELDALWTGYKKSSLTNMFQGGETPSPATACMMFSTMDRGTSLFGGKPGVESDKVSEFMPTVPSILGLKANGVIGALDEATKVEGSRKVDSLVHGSAASYAIFSSKSKRPIYSPRQAAAEASKPSAGESSDTDAQVAVDRIARNLASFDPSNEAAPRDEDGELVLRRREVHSGRAISVSAVEWSVADKMAKPTSALEGYMWDKETEVDRFRERVPLQNLVSQCKLYNLDPTKPKPRDFLGPLRDAANSNDNDNFVILPECKRMEPSSGSLRKRYNVAKITKEFTLAGARAISVNCDPVLFGGALEDITLAREAAQKAAVLETSDDGAVAPPIIASDLILYPYQLYKLRLAGADAVRLVAGALEAKDLLYLTKIAQSLQMQSFLSVSSEKQLQSLVSLSPGSVSAVVVSNRMLEDFSFDESGEQALALLRSDAMKEFVAAHGDAPIFVEGRVGMIEREGANGTKCAANYIKELKDAGAFGAFAAGGLADNDKSVADALQTLCDAASV